MILVSCIQIAIACYTSIAEKILIFQITSITPTKYLKGYNIFLSQFQIRSQIKLGLQFAIFTVTDIFPVYPQIHIRTYRSEMSHNFLSFPICRYCNLPAIRSHMIAFYRHIRWIISILISPSISYVYINRISISVQFPYSWYL